MSKSIKTFRTIDLNLIIHIEDKLINSQNHKLITMHLNPPYKT